MDIQFNGQQEGENILYELHPHVFAKYIALVKIIVLALVFYIVLGAIAFAATSLALLLHIGGLILAAFLIIGGIWWNNKMFSKSVTYITDRRIIRFEQVTPFLKTKRALFWNEALKAKGYAPNLIYKTFNVGNVLVEPHLSDNENVMINNVYYYEDVANYIDKILYTFKNKPQEIDQIKPFVPKPRGQRYE